MPVELREGNRIYPKKISPSESLEIEEMVKRYPCNEKLAARETVPLQVPNGPVAKPLISLEPQPTWIPVTVPPTTCCFHAA
jgi:hypothetical protein